MKYRVYSPNCIFINDKSFDSLEEAYDYYDACIVILMNQNDTHMIQMQLEDENGEIIDKGTILDNNK